MGAARFRVLSLIGVGMETVASHTAVAAPVWRLLSVDDDPNVSWALGRRLRKHGIEVISACHGMHALALSTQAPPDVIVTDLCMPLGCGEELIRSLRGFSWSGRVPVLVLSGKCTRETEKRLRRLGVTHILDKPLDVNKLLQALRDCLPLAPSDLAESEQISALERAP